MNTGNLKRIANALINTRAAGMYILVFAAAIGIATFIENDFGTSSAQKIIYKAKWFELLLILFGTTILANIVRYRMIQQKKWPTFLFHFAILIILAGAAATRYVGFEGIMHIREGDSSKSFVSTDTYLQLEFKKDGHRYRIDEPVLFATLGNNQWQESYLIGNEQIDVRVDNFIPNPVFRLLPDDNGSPIYKMVIGGNAGREEYFIQKGDRRRINDLLINFNDTYVLGAINLQYRNDSMLIGANQTMTRMTMATRALDTISTSGQFHPLVLRSLYTVDAGNFVFSEFRDQGSVAIVSEHHKVKNESRTALKVSVAIDGEISESYVYGQKGVKGRPISFKNKDVEISIAYGAKSIELPFSIKLKEFVLEKYPGTNSASSYASEVSLIDPKNGDRKDFRIFMNNILKHRGYRFFQSSFDKDEKGTYLSVNYDSLGTNISYLGYFLLTLGMILALLNKKSRFIYLSKRIRKLQQDRKIFVASIFVMLSLASHNISSAQNGPSGLIVSEEHADVFSEIVVQDYKGRMKPMHTLTRELMRKIYRKESLGGLSADQVVLGMYADNASWHAVPLIKIGKHEEIISKIGTSEKHAAYRDFFGRDGQYIFKDEVRRAYGLQPIDRGMYEKELLKIDERVNIASMIFSGNIFKIIPLANDVNNTWVSNHRGNGADEVSRKFFEAYKPSLIEASNTSDYAYSNLLINELKNYQRNKGAAVIPSKAQIVGEIWLNELNVFNRLAGLYTLLGMTFLSLLFISVFKPSARLKEIYIAALVIMVLGFIFHTLGLVLRWYVSERAPWSNGYESMIYIAWTTSLAGVLFTRKSLGGLAGTMVLAATVLLVASLSYLDPEITPLVPVLKSYWLTIHVSLEAGSYGFLMLGAIIGLINLILMIFLTASNKDRIKRIVTEMSYISEMTLMGGLLMISVGTYLGGVWANESWGRYWGWDAKETWALVTILIYAFILHMRLIPKINGLFAYNVGSLFGWASVIMTYYGVNYYLSGLHSYAAGDPIPVPNWVYISVMALVLISGLAYWKNKKWDLF